MYAGALSSVADPVLSARIYLVDFRTATGTTASACPPGKQTRIMTTVHYVTVRERVVAAMETLMMAMRGNHIDTAMRARDQCANGLAVWARKKTPTMGSMPMMIILIMARSLGSFLMYTEAAAVTPVACEISA